MASRGAAGGLARGTADLVAVLDAFGMDVVIVETVGAGQDEVEIVRMVDTTVVVAVPGLGDDVQALKAGILEVADVLVVNKADRDGADQVAGDLRAALALGPRTAWEVPIIRTVATTGAGVDELVAAVQRHREHLQAGEEWRARRAAAARRRVVALVEQRLRERMDALFRSPGWLERFTRAAERTSDPYALVEQALEELSAPEAPGPAGILPGVPSATSGRSRDAPGRTPARAAHHRRPYPGPSATPRAGAAGRRPAAGRAAARQGQADRSRAAGPVARSRHVPGVGRLRHAPRDRVRDRRRALPRRWRGDRFRQGGRPAGVRLQPGLHRVWRLTL